MGTQGTESEAARADRDAGRADQGLGVRARRRRDNRVWRYALLVSAVGHLLLFLLGGDRPIPLAPLAAAGPRAGDDRPASGGMQAVNVIVPPTRPIERPFIPVLAEIDVEPVEFDLDQAFEESAFLGERPGDDVGKETGDGEGDGGTGDGGGVTDSPPVMRHLVYPPEGQRGLRMRVWVFVTEVGDVVADSTRLDPPSRDRRFNDRMVDEAADWKFRPATRNGLPVAAWYSYLLRVSGRS